MPFKSQAQRAYMHINHPEIADRWEKETPPGKLPKHVQKREREEAVESEIHRQLAKE